PRGARVFPYPTLFRSDLDSRDGTPGLTVVCAALNIASEAVLRPSVCTVVLGGVAEPYSFELTGPLATATMRDLWLDTMFVGTVGDRKSTRLNSSHVSI